MRREVQVGLKRFVIEDCREQRYLDSMRGQINQVRRHDGQPDCQYTDQEINFLCECYEAGRDSDGVEVEDLALTMGVDVENLELLQEARDQMYCGHMDS